MYCDLKYSLGLTSPNANEKVQTYKEEASLPGTSVPMG